MNQTQLLKKFSSFSKKLYGFLVDRIVFLKQIDFWKLFLALKFNTWKERQIKD